MIDINADFPLNSNVIPSARAESISCAFDWLNDSDAVIGPSSDSGYWLIGMNKFIPVAFGLSSWRNASLLNETAETFRRLGISYKTADIIDDLDTPEDLRRYKNL